MVEYSQPNTHKEFHVGHLRNVCLGSALVKLFRYCGYQVTAANYFGDEGAHIAKCLWMMKKLGKNPGPTDEKGAWLGEIYVAAAIFDVPNRIMEQKRKSGAALVSTDPKILPPHPNQTQGTTL